MSIGSLYASYEDARKRLYDALDLEFYYGARVRGWIKPGRYSVERPGAVICVTYDCRVRLRFDLPTGRTIVVDVDPLEVVLDAAPGPAVSSTPR